MWDNEREDEKGDEEGWGEDYREGGTEVGAHRRRQWCNGGRWPLDNRGTAGREDRGA